MDLSEKRLNNYLDSLSSLEQKLTYKKKYEFLKGKDIDSISYTAFESSYNKTYAEPSYMEIREMVFLITIIVVFISCFENQSDWITEFEY